MDFKYGYIELIPSIFLIETLLFSLSTVVFNPPGEENNTALSAIDPSNSNSSKFLIFILLSIIYFIIFSIVTL